MEFPRRMALRNGFAAGTCPNPDRRTNSIKFNSRKVSRSVQPPKNAWPQKRRGARLDIACSNRIALPKSVLKTCSQAWQEPSQDFQNSHPKLSQMWPEPYKSIQIRGTFWIVGTFSERFKSLRTLKPPRSGTAKSQKKH